MLNLYGIYTDSLINQDRKHGDVEWNPLSKYVEKVVGAYKYIYVYGYK